MEDIPIPDEIDERRQLAADVIEAIMAMENPRDREALMLYKIEGRDVEDVASMLKTTPGNVYTRCSRAMESLRTILVEGKAHV